MDNPQAFPEIEQGGGFQGTTGGMTLRDYFAGQAISGLMIANNSQGSTFVKDAFIIADAMLKERERDE